MNLKKDRLMKDRQDKQTPEVDTSAGVFTPEKIAQRCPVCNGFGSLKYGTVQCHGCKGKGYVLVPAKRSDKPQKGGSVS